MGKYGFGTVYTRNGIYWIKYHVDGKPHYESSESTERNEAEKLLKRRLADVERGLSSGRSDRVNINALLDGLLVDYRLNNPRSVAFAEVNVRAFLRPFFGTVKAARITTDKLNAYREHRMQQGAAKATINREMSLLRRAYSLGRASTPPKVLVSPKFPMFREDNVRTGFLEYVDYERLKKELPDSLRFLLILGYHTGCRVSELLRLQWTQVDFVAKEIHLRAGTTKNDEGRLIPIYGEMLPALEALRASHAEYRLECEYVFQRAGKPMKDFRHAWDKACDRAGLRGLHFHDLRRSAVRNMIRAGVPEKVAMAISGHKTRSVFDRYNIVTGKDLLEAGEKIHCYLSEAKGKTVTKTVTSRESKRRRARL